MTKKKSINEISLFISELQKVGLIIAISALITLPFGLVWVGIVSGLLLYIVYLISVGLRYYKALQLLNFSTLPSNGRLLTSISDNILGIHKKQRELNKRLKKQVKSQSSMLDAWPDAMIVLDKGYVIQQYNRQAVVWLGLSHNDKGQYVNNIIRDVNLLKLLKNHEPNSHEVSMEGSLNAKFMIHSPTNPRLILQVRLVDFIDGLYLLIFNDVTQRQNVSRMRKDFIANISHELKTPLTSIKGFSELLVETATEEQKHYVDYLMSQTGRMENIVEDLLKLSTLESSVEPSETKVVKLSEIIEKEAVLLNDLYPEVSIQTHLDESLAIYGEASEWQSLVNNLLNNAINHNEGKVAIVCEWSMEKPQIESKNDHKEFSEHNDLTESSSAVIIKRKPSAILTIRDNGIGVDKTVLPLLTERFYRTDESRENQAKNKGSGLGLSIVKHVVERHQGRLLVDSQINQGFSVRCIIPNKKIVK